MKSGPCAFCGDPATRWCDFVYGHQGKPGPGDRLYFDLEGEMFTCDAALCSACAVSQPPQFFAWFCGCAQPCHCKHEAHEIDHCPGHPSGLHDGGAITRADADQARAGHLAAARRRRFSLRAKVAADGGRVTTEVARKRDGGKVIEVYFDGVPVGALPLES